MCSALLAAEASHPSESHHYRRFVFLPHNHPLYHYFTIPLLLLLLSACFSPFVCSLCRFFSVCPIFSITSLPPPLSSLYAYLSLSPLPFTPSPPLLSSLLSPLSPQYGLKQSPDPQKVQLATTTITKLIDGAVKGHCPDAKEMDVWGEKTKSVECNLFPPMLANAATHVQTLPMRPMDFLTCNFSSLAECIDKIVREANRHERRVRLDVQKVAQGSPRALQMSPLGYAEKVFQDVDAVPKMDLAATAKEAEGKENVVEKPPPTPFELLLAKTYKSESLLKVAADKWKVEAAPPPPPPTPAEGAKGGAKVGGAGGVGGSPSGSPRTDSKSEACSLA